MVTVQSQYGRQHLRNETNSFFIRGVFVRTFNHQPFQTFQNWGFASCCAEVVRNSAKGFARQDSDNVVVNHYANQLQITFVKLGFEFAAVEVVTDKQKHFAVCICFQFVATVFQFFKQTLNQRQTFDCFQTFHVDVTGEKVHLQIFVQRRDQVFVFATFRVGHERLDFRVAANDSRERVQRFRFNFARFIQSVNGNALAEFEL